MPAGSKARGVRGRLPELVSPSWSKRRRLFPAPTGPLSYLRGCLGGMALVVFAAQVLSGLAILAWFQPWSQGAGPGILGLESGGAPGWMLRRLHAGGAGLLLLLLLMHLVRVLWSGAFRPPREWNWLSGLGLAGLVFLAALSGKALAGPGLEASSWWLVAMHLGLPFVVILILRIHFRMVRRTGVAGPL